MSGFKLPPRGSLRDSIDQRPPMTIGIAFVPPTPPQARLGGCVTLCEFDWRDESDATPPQVSHLALVRLDNWAELQTRLSDSEIVAAVRSWYTPNRDAASVRVRYDMGNGYYILLIEELLA